MTPTDLRDIRRRYQNSNCWTAGSMPEASDPVDCLQGPPDSNSAVLHLPREDVQLLHVTQIMPMSKGGFWFWVAYAPLLALQHFNARHSPFLPNLAHQIGQDCNLYLTMSQYSSDFSVGTGSKRLYEAVATGTSSSKHNATTFASPKTGAVLGSVRSAVSASLSWLTAAYELPHISPASTSSELDNKDKSTTFARTVPTNRGDAHALIAYLQHLNVHHFNVLYLRDEYGTAFYQEILAAAKGQGMTVVAASYGDNNQGESNQDDVQLAMKTIQGSGYRYTFAVSLNGVLLDSLYELGLLQQQGHVWIMSEACSWIADDPTFSTHPGLARAMHGWAYLTIHTPPNQAFLEALDQVKTDPEAQELLRDSVVPSDYWEEDFDFASSLGSPSNKIYVQAAYDAMMALGISACRASRQEGDSDSTPSSLSSATPNFFSGMDHYNQLVGASFEGASGHVAFNKTTGTRSYTNFQFSVFNLLMDPEQSDNETARFRLTETHRIDFSSSEANDAKMPIITELDIPFYYSDNTTNIPPALPPPEPQDLNLISDTALIVGWALTGVTILLALAALVWVITQRNSNRIIQASQPVFLALICAGAIVMAVTAIPLGFQEPMPLPLLNAACMVTPWFSMGFTIAFSALFSKTMRVYKIYRSAAAMKRITVGVQDVARPMVALACVNLILLILWHLLDPLQWKRVEVSYNLDPYGRPRESYGSCYVNLTPLQQGFLYSLMAVNAIPVLIANYMSFKARHIPSDVLNETLWIQISMATILEVILIGGPFVLVTSHGQETTATYIVLTVLFCVTALASFVPVMVSKIWLLRDHHDDNASRLSMFSRQSTVVTQVRPFFSPVPTMAGEGPAATHLKHCLRITNRHPSAVRVPSSHHSHSHHVSSGIGTDDAHSHASSSRASHLLANGMHHLTGSILSSTLSLRRTFLASFGAGHAHNCDGASDEHHHHHHDNCNMATNSDHGKDLEHQREPRLSSFSGRPSWLVPVHPFSKRASLGATRDKCQSTGALDLEPSANLPNTVDSMLRQAPWQKQRVGATTASTNHLAREYDA